MMNAEVKEIGEVLEENEITSNEDIQELCYESLKDLFPGGGRRIIQRSKAWKVIVASLKNESLRPKVTSPSASLNSATRNRPLTPRSAMTPRTATTPRTSSPSESLTPQSSLSRSSSPFVPINIPESPTNSDITVAAFQDPEKNSKQEAKAPVWPKPVYSIYTDADVLSSDKNGQMSKEIRNRLVRGTIHNMVTVASSSPFGRFPTHSELEEMSKSLVIRYPCLRDSETGHGVILKQLKRRLSNTKPVKKRQGPCPKKRKIFREEPQKEVEESKKEDSSSTSLSNDDEHPVDESDNEEIMARHYNALKREMEKKNPNEDVVNFYLNKEFPSRREWLKEIGAEERAVKLLEEYPCFKDHVEVIEEARRVIRADAGKPQDFMRNCVDKLPQEIDFMIYYGIDAKGITPPRSPHINAKIMYTINLLATLFPGKQKPTKKQSGQELIHQLKDHA